MSQLSVISTIWYLSASDDDKQYYHISGRFHQMKYDAVCPSPIQGGFLNIGFYFGFISITTFSNIYFNCVFLNMAEQGQADSCDFGRLIIIRPWHFGVVLLAPWWRQWTKLIGWWITRDHQQNNVKPYMYKDKKIWCQKLVFRTRISNYTPLLTMVCNTYACPSPL